MADVASTGLETVKAQAATARVLALIAVITLLINTIWQFGIAPLIEALRTMRAEPALGPFWALGVIGPKLILALPTFLFIDTLEAFRRAFKEYEEGRFFSVAAGAGMRRAGDVAGLAIAAKIIIAPTLYQWVTQRGGGIKVDFDTFDLGLIAFALFVGAIGRVLVAAAEIKAENDQIV